MNFLLKRLIKVVAGNHNLQIKLFFFLADIIVKRTDNDLDDKFLLIMRDALGYVDTSDLEK